MPMPTPDKGEVPKDFVKRCMSDAQMKQDYSDPKQRLATCVKQSGG